MPKEIVITSVSPIDEGAVLYFAVVPSRNLESNTLQDQQLLEHLLERIRAGEEAGLSSFYQKTVSRVYGLALKITKRQELAEEVINDVYLQVWNKADHYDKTKANPLAWLMMICRSRSLDKLRRENTRVLKTVDIEQQSDLKDESFTTPDSQICDNEMNERVSMAMKCLTEAQRQAVGLAFFRDMSQSEIAIYTGLPLGTVKTNIRRAQAVLRNALTADGGEHYVNV